MLSIFALYSNSDHLRSRKLHCSTQSQGLLLKIQPHRRQECIIPSTTLPSLTLLTYLSELFSTMPFQQVCLTSYPKIGRFAMGHSWIEMTTQTFSPLFRTVMVLWGLPVPSISRTFVDHSSEVSSHEVYNESAINILL